MNIANGSDSRLHEVYFVFDTEFTGDLWSLSREAHVWLIKSRHNDPLARSVWAREGETYSALRGVSLFGDLSEPTKTFYSDLGTIDQHHDEYSASRPWDVIHVVGLALEQVSGPRIASELHLDSVRLEREERGFAIRRVH